MTTHDATTARCTDHRSRRLGRFAAGVLIAGACVLPGACAQDPPRQMAFGEEIQVGPYAFTVQRARNAPNPPPPINTFHKQEGRKAIVVFVDWKKLDQGMEPLRRIAFVENFLEKQLSILDAEGKRTPALSAMQEKLMFMADPGPNWRDWIVVFHVPDGSRDLKLLVENPEPREGQTRLSAVPLGM